MVNVAMAVTENAIRSRVTKNGVGGCEIAGADSVVSIGAEGSLMTVEPDSLARGRRIVYAPVFGLARGVRRNPCLKASDHTIQSASRTMLPDILDVPAYRSVNVMGISRTRKPSIHA